MDVKVPDLLYVHDALSLISDCRVFREEEEMFTHCASLTTFSFFQNFEYRWFTE